MTTGAETAFSKAPKVLKYITTFAVYYGNIGNAIAFGCIGPSLTSLGYVYDTEESTISKVSTVFGIACVVGAILAGILFKYMNRQLCAIIFLVLEAISIALLPNLPSVTWFFIAAGALGICGGLYNTATVSWVIDIWRHESGPFIQAQHFFFGVGSLITPLLLGPFLADDKAGDDSPSSSTQSAPSASPNFFVPFAVAGVVVLLAALFQLVLYFIYRKRSLASLSETASSEENQVEESGKTEEKQAEQAEQSVNTEEKPVSRKRTILLIILLSVFVGFYTMTEQVHNLFFSKFAQNSPVDLSEAGASRVLAALQFTYAGGRLVGIFIIIKLAPQWLLLSNFVLVVLGNAILAALGASNETWLWVGSACLGLGFSTAVPAFFAFAERRLFINDTVASITTVGTGVLLALYPLLISEFIGSFPAILIYCNFANISIAFVSFAIMYKITYSRVTGSN